MAKYKLPHESAALAAALRQHSLRAGAILEAHRSCKCTAIGLCDAESLLGQGASIEDTLQGRAGAGHAGLEGKSCLPWRSPHAATVYLSVPRM